MAKEKTTQGKVEIMVPRGSANDDPNLFISVNGKNYLLPRGKRSTVPGEVAFEFYRAMTAQEALDKKVQEMVDEGKR